MRKYMTDAPKKTTYPSTSAKIKIKDSGLARKTRVATFYGSEYSANREGDSLNVYEEGGEGISQRKLVSAFFGKAFFAEVEADETCIYLMSGDVVATSMLGDRSDTKMTAALYQQRIIGKVRRLAGMSR
jgi:hypothetical protein